MRTSKKDRFITIRSEGGLLPLDFLERVALLDQEISGLTPADYHLLEHEKINESINRAWDRLLGCWVSFKSATKNANEDDPLIRETRERWLLPLFDALGYGRLTPCKSIELDGRNFQISHMWQKMPLHLVGAGVELDRRTAGVAGAARSAPHGMVQDFLNHSDEHLWAFVSNGRKLRILRDNVSLTRQAFVEFDLEGMMDGEQFSDFRVLYLLCHQSRVEQEKSQDFWLERWTAAAQLSGVRVREELGRGVEEAISALGTGLLQHPANSELRSKLKSGNLSAQDFYRQILRTVYRLLFLFVAEDRGALLRRESSIEARKTYTDYYSTQRIREMAGSRKGSHHHDLWQLQRLVFESLGQESGCPELALPALGSFLWSRDSVKEIAACELSNRNFLSAVFALAFTEEGKAKRAVDFKNLKTEELGSVYEALLEMHPHVDLENNRFGLFGESGSERKKTGSYYTPASLVSCLIDSAMNPIIERISKKTNAKDLLLAVKICDPSCGSGHFLLAAANRLARALAAARSEDVEPSPEAYRIALRDVISNCIYGVDLNEMSVELCKVNLWLESVDAERPLSFLDNKIKCGNSLLGTTPALIAEGIPDDAFEPIEGDDKTFARQVKKANKEQSQGQLHISALDRKNEYAVLSNERSKIGALAENSLQSVHLKEENYAGLIDSEQYKKEKFLCDAWCSAFVWPLRPGGPQPITRAMFSLAASDRSRLAPAIVNEVATLAARYRFFHWHLEFPEVFFAQNSVPESNSRHGWTGGFDVVLGNPPWERIKLQEEEWFAARVPEIAQARTAAIRGKMIKELQHSDEELFNEFIRDRRQAEGESHFVRKSGRFPLCGRGDINTYSIFAETMRDLMSPVGYAGFIVPSGIATDDTTKLFFRSLVESKSLRSLFDFENRKAIFSGVHRSYKFSLVTLAGLEAAKPDAQTDFVFFALGTEDLADEDKHFKLSAADIALLNPNTGTCPIFRSKTDAELTKKLYRRVPVFVREVPQEENTWDVKFLTMFHMANDSELFNTKQTLLAKGFSPIGNCFQKVESGSTVKYLPLYEAKMVHQFDTKWATYKFHDSSAEPEIQDVSEEQKLDPRFVVFPRYWISESEVQARLKGKTVQNWLLGWRDICRNTDERTVIAALLPVVAVGHKMPLMISDISIELAACLLANLNAFVLDYCARQKHGSTSLIYATVRQLPILPRATYSDRAPWQQNISLEAWISQRALRLAGIEINADNGESVTCDLEARRKLRSELDAAFMILYGLTRSEIEYLLDTFIIVNNHDLRRWNRHKTKEDILMAFDALIEASNRGAMSKVSAS